MDRRGFLVNCVVVGGVAVFVGLTGCRGHQFAKVLKSDDQDMVGSHSAGAETFNPLIDEALAQLLGRHTPQFHQAGFAQPQTPPGPLSICFVGVENRSAEELGDFKEQIYHQIDAQIVQSGAFRPISKRFVDAGLRETRLRPDSLFNPSNMQIFQGAMHQMGQPFDYLLYANITSGTTESNHSYQRDYLLTMELVNIRTGQYDKQIAKVRKGYHRSRMGSLKHYNPFKKTAN